MAGIRAIVGLGNPGSEYENTRHNAGFLTIDALASQLGVNYWKSQDGSMVGIGKNREGEQIVLAKPQAFMNRSGGPVKGILTRYGLSIDEILVIHDELDLPEGVIRLKRGGGHAGHNGLRSIIDSVGKDFARLRIGIGRPPGRMDVASFVLQVIKGDVLEELKVSANQAAEIAQHVMEHGLDSAMQKYHVRSESAN